jgi:hypothetical protein
MKKLKRRELTLIKLSLRFTKDGQKICLLVSDPGTLLNNLTMTKNGAKSLIPYIILKGKKGIRETSNCLKRV